MDGIEKETDENKYDLVILGTSYVNSWLKSAFSDSMKIVRKINIPVLLIHE
jgi:nucleotide-binding universal stress UspA family protein